MSLLPHTLPPGEATLELRLGVVLPGVESAADGCVARLQAGIAAQNGVSRVHLESDNGKPVLCLHYDPNLMPLEKLERLARDAGAGITQRYHHENLRIDGMDCASCAAGIEHVVRRLPGVLAVAVSYAGAKMKVEYDSTLAAHEDIVRAVRKLGYRISDGCQAGRGPAGTDQQGQGRPEPSHEGHDHQGHDHNHPGHHGHEGHVHGEPPKLPQWWPQPQHAELALSLLAGALLLVGYALQLRFGGPGAAMPGGAWWAPFVVGALYAAAYCSGGWHLARHSIPTTLHGRFDVEFLMLMGACGAALLGQFAEGAFLLFLFSLGHALENYAMQRARDAIGALGQLAPRTARVRRDGTLQEIEVERVQVGDTAIVRAGERIAVDGTVRRGRSEVDQSALTGESLPVAREPGQPVLAGSINGAGGLEVEVDRLAGDTTMARVIEMVEEAQAQKSPTQSFTDRFERRLVPLVLGLVALAAVAMPLGGWLSWNASLLRSIGALVAASPCALALATPAAVLAGIAQAARHGVLIKGGVHLENLGAVRAIAFDKTGTLTRGKLSVVDSVCEGIAFEEMLRMAAAIELRAATHPLAQAVVRRAEELGLQLPDAGEVRTVAGLGVESVVLSREVLLGNARFFEERAWQIPEAITKALGRWGEAGQPTIIIGRDGAVVGALALADGERTEAKTALQRLRRAGVEALVMLTGDNAAVAQHIAAATLVTDVRAGLLPEEKVAVLRDLLARFKRVAMVGDGVNDAPALAHATVGIAMGAGGSAVALETADVALMADDLSKLPYAVSLSRLSRHIIRQNLFIALGVIVLLVPAALLGFVNLGEAVVLHEGSTLVVVCNALRLLGFSPAHD